MDHLLSVAVSNSNGDNNNDNNGIDTFLAERWTECDMLEKQMRSMLDSYAVLMKDYVKKLKINQQMTSDDVSKMKALRDEILDITERTVVLRRWLHSQTYIQYNLKRFDIFLSHAGEQKSSYACWLEDKLKENNHTVFFDENSLKSGNDFESIMLHAALTCRVAIIVVSPDFLTKWWTLLELFVFAARIRRRNKLLTKKLGEKISDNDLIDMHFNLIPDFYDRDCKWNKWVDVVVDSIASVSPLESFPTGHRLEQKLDSVHAMEIVKETHNILSSQENYFCDVLTNFNTEFSKLYNKFAVLQQKVYSLTSCPKQKSDHSIDFHLLVTQWYEKDHFRKGTPEDLAFYEARQAGRSVMKFVIDNPSQVHNNEHTFIAHGYAELTNVYLFTAPLDALNWKIMNTQYNDVLFNKWAEVTLMNEKAEDVHSKFIILHHCVKLRLMNKEITKDPFPTNIMDEICLQNIIGKNSLPNSLK